jgi:hypothetical protein
VGVHSYPPRDSNCFVWTVCADYLDLWNNYLTGTIPSEIGMLTQLSEYTVIDCQEAFVYSLSASIRIHLIILIVCLDYLCREARSSGQ